MATVGFDGTVTEAQWSAMQLRASEIAYRHGVWSGGEVTPGTGRAVNVAALDAWIAGIWHTTTAPTSVTITANAGTNRRVDYIAAEANWTTNAVTLVAVPGVAAAAPVAPALTQNAGVLWQMPLARVTVAGNATTIAATDIQVAAVRRWDSPRYSTTVNVDTMRGGATSWNTLGNIVVDDPGRSYRADIRATVMFAQTESAANMRIRVVDVDAGTSVGEGITPVLRAGKAPAVLTRVTSTESGLKRFRLEMLPSAEMSAAEQVQVLDHGVNQFIVTLLPA